MTAFLILFVPLLLIALFFRYAMHCTTHWNPITHTWMKTPYRWYGE